MRQEQKTHILIVYENTGGGHKKLAKILEEYLSEENVRLTLMTTSQLICENDNIFVHHWNKFLKKSWIRLADLWLNFISRIFLLPFYYSLYPQVLFRSLDSLKPDVIISTADVNRLLGSYCQARHIPFYIFITSGTIFVDMLSCHAMHVVYFQETAKIVRHVHMTQYFKRDIVPQTSWSVRLFDIIYLFLRYSLGYKATPYFHRYRPTLKLNNTLQVSVLGPLREKLFYQSKEKSVIKNNYNIPEDGHCVLISNGSLGGKVVVDVVNAILKRSYPHGVLNLIAICGADMVLYQQIKNIVPPQWIRIIPISVQDSLADLYQIADCSIGRGTAGILMDSVVSQTPLIVLNKVTTNDFGTLDTIRKYKIGVIANTIKEIPNLLRTVLLQNTQYTQAFKDFVSQYGMSNLDAIQSNLRKIIFRSERCVEKDYCE